MSSFQQAIKSPVGRKKKVTRKSSSADGFVSSLSNNKSPILSSGAGSVVFVGGNKKIPALVKKELGIVAVGKSTTAQVGVAPVVEHDDGRGPVVDESLEIEPIVDTPNKSLNLSICQRFDLLLGSIFGSQWRHYLDPSESLPALLMFLILSLAWTTLLWIVFSDLK
jgi:hypothetical protein